MAVLYTPVNSTCNYGAIEFVYMDGITDRAKLLIESTSLDDLTRAGETNYNRWMNLKRGRARVGADEIEILCRKFPQYRWWLLTGETMPDKGQTSPAYDEADRNLG